MQSENETKERKGVDGEIVRQGFTFSRENLEFIIDAAHLGLWWSDPPFDKLHRNREASRHFCADPDEDIDLVRFFSLIHHDDREACKKAALKAVAERGLYDFTFRTSPRNGAFKWVRTIGRAHYDPAGKPVRFSGISQDITPQKKIEEELRKSERRIRLASEVSRLGIWHWDLVSSELIGSDICMDLFGFSREAQISYDAFRNRLHPDDRERVEEELIDDIKGRKDFDTEHRIVLPNSGIRWVHAKGNTIRDENGKPLRMIGVVLDVTEQKLIEEALQRSERRLLLALDSGNMGIWEWDLETGRFEWSEGHFTLLGYKAGEVEPSYDAFRNRVHPEDLSRQQRVVGRALKEHKDYVCEFRVIWPDGSLHWLEARGRYIYDEDGRATRMLGVLIDIDRQKSAERALRESDDRFRAFMDNSPTTAWMKDEHGRYVYLSAPGEKSFGATFKECCRKKDFEIFPIEKARQYRASDLKVLRSGRYWDVVEDSTYPDGSRYAWWKIKFPFTDSAGRRYVGGIGLDITEHRQTEEELRRVHEEFRHQLHERTIEVERLKQELDKIPLAMLAARDEERNRTLSGLEGAFSGTFVSLAKGLRNILDTHARKGLQESLGLIKSFLPELEHSLEQTGTLCMHLMPVTLEETGLIPCVECLCREKFPALYPGLHVELDIGIAEEQIADSLKLAVFRIVQEALTNVAKHSRAEWVDVSLTQKNNNMELTLSDDGIGFDMNEVMSHPEKACGITDMRKRVELLGGVFSLSSIPGEGTVIRAAWPMHDNGDRF